jgi:hypothetical protein
MLAWRRGEGAGAKPLRPSVSSFLFWKVGVPDGASVLVGRAEWSGGSSRAWRGGAAAVGTRPGVVEPRRSASAWRSAEPAERRMENSVCLLNGSSGWNGGAEWAECGAESMPARVAEPCQAGGRPECGAVPGLGVTKGERSGGRRGPFAFANYAGGPGGRANSPPAIFG